MWCTAARCETLDTERVSTNRALQGKHPQLPQANGCIGIGAGAVGQNASRLHTVYTDHLTALFS